MSTQKRFSPKKSLTFLVTVAMGSVLTLVGPTLLQWLERGSSYAVDWISQADVRDIWLALLSGIVILLLVDRRGLRRRLQANAGSLPAAEASRPWYAGGLIGFLLTPFMAEEESGMTEDIADIALEEAPAAMGKS